MLPGTLQTCRPKELLHTSTGGWPEDTSIDPPGIRPSLLNPVLCHVHRLLTRRQGPLQEHCYNHPLDIPWPEKIPSSNREVRRVRVHPSQLA